jgi:hypothetical protein
MNISFTVTARATIPSVLTFIAVDAAVEWIAGKITGTTFLQLFEKTEAGTFGFRFHVVNLILFSLEIYLVMIFYSMVRNRFNSPVKPAFLTVVFFMVFTSLFLFQIINLGIYPLKAGIVFLTTIGIAFPGAVSTGAAVYERYYRQR